MIFATAEMPVWTYLREVYFRQSGVLSRESKQDYEIQVGQFCGWWLERSRPYRPPVISDLTRSNIQECRAWKASTRSVSTANHIKRVITAVCNHAAEAGLIPFPGRIRNLREPQREPRAWGLDEYARIVATSREVPGKRQWMPLCDLMPAFYRLAYDSGARIDTLLSVRWTWLALGDACCTIPADRTKDKQEMIVELSRSTVDSLVNLGAGKRASSDLVFGDWKESTFRRLHKRIVYAALIDPTADLSELRGHLRRKAEQAVGRLECFHKIRRTTATEITAVAGEAIASKALGHSSIAVTRRYLDKRRLKQTVQAAQRPEIPESPALRVLRAE